MTTLLTPPTLQLAADPEAPALPPPDEHDRWLEIRRTGFGGSEAAAALGLNRYSSPYKLFCEKLGLIPDFVGNEPTRWGKLLEDVVANEAARRLGADTVLTPTAMYRSKTWPWMLANPDRFLVFSDGSVAFVSESPLRPPPGAGPEEFGGHEVVASLGGQGDRQPGPQQNRLEGGRGVVD
jgi:putative phage-type endonuclease